MHFRVHEGSHADPPGDHGSARNRNVAISAVSGFVITLMVAWFVGEPGAWSENMMLLWLFALVIAAAAAVLFWLNLREERSANAAEKRAQRAHEDTARALERAEARVSEYVALHGRRQPPTDVQGR